jgi:hypothetical protein
MMMPSHQLPCSKAQDLMTNPTDEEIAVRLVDIINDGFNLSIGALVQAGALDTTKMQEHYTGVGSKFYDLVTEQITLTARYGTPGVRQLFSHDTSNA